MTVSRVLFDTWAWWEVIHATEIGGRIATRYIEVPEVEVHTSAISFGEISAKLHAIGAAHKVADALAAVAAFSQTHDVTPDLATEAGRLRAELRRTTPDAGLGDGIIWATARSIGATLLSADAAFVGRDDVLTD